MTAPVVSARGLCKSFAPTRSLMQLWRGVDKVKVLDHVDLDVAAGEVVAIEGANGAGKSTLLRVLAGLLVADTGTVVLDGVNVARDRVSAARRYSYLAGDERGLPARATVRQTLQLFAGLHGLSIERSVRETNRNLDAFGLQSESERRVGDLSTGQRRRLQLAAASFGNAKLLLLDEPTRGIDAEMQVEIWHHLRRFAERGVAIIIASHSAEERRALGARCMELTDGKLVSA